MAESGHYKVIGRLAITCVLCALYSHFANAQVSFPAATIAESSSASIPRAYEQPLRFADARGALRLACRRKYSSNASDMAERAIIIGFVGGFVRGDDLNHPEVQFADFLRERYGEKVNVEVFSNHNGKQALGRVLQLLDTAKGVQPVFEKRQVDIVIYGHSWGGSQTIALAQYLGRLGIPVQLTVQVDSVRKLHQQDSTIPSNVAKAINFYQTKGPIHGRSAIRAADPERTHILDNVEMKYSRHSINCRNYPVLARLLNKPHHEIENDPRVWDRITLLIDAVVSLKTSAATLP